MRDLNWDLLSDLFTVCKYVIPTIVSIVCISINRIRTKRWKATQSIALEAMSEVEVYAKTHYGFDSAQKLQRAITITEIEVKACKLPWNDEVKEQVISYIAEMCSWSKTVNCNK